MKANQILLMIMILSLIPFSCSKEEDTTGGNYYYEIDKRLYPLLFNKESNWIYKNMDTNIIDSISLIEIIMDTIGPFNVGKGFTQTFQVFNLRYSSRLYGEYSEQYVGYVISKGSINGGYVYLSSFQAGDSSMNAKITAIHDSLIVNEMIYKNVVEMDIKKDMYIENDMHLFYVDSIGLIKKEIKEENNIKTSWELLNYNIDYLELE
jgi:hypothetical protein